MSPILIAAGLFSSLVGQAQGDGQEQLPAWVEPAMAMLKEDGLLVGYPSVGHGSRTPTRYEGAVATHATAEYMWSVLHDLSRVEGDAEELAILRTWKPHMGTMRRLVAELSKELAYVGADVPATRARLDKCERLIISLPKRLEPFSDVPAGHWAAGAANRLKRAGMLAGYPDGKFRG